MAEDKAIIPPAGDERTAMMKGLGTGALAAGAVALLFGSKGTRKFASKAIKLGGTAAVGGLAYKAFSDWQAQQQAASQPAGGTEGVSGGIPSGGATAAAQSAAAKRFNLDQFDVGTPIAKLSDIDAAVRSESIIQAMISAARSDGHINDEELALITAQIESLGLEKDVSAFLISELNKPVSVDSIAALADTPETAAELYIASAMVVDMDSAPERGYLDNLSSAMNLDADMVRLLEAPLRE